MGRAALTGHGRQVGRTEFSRKTIYFDISESLEGKMGFKELFLSTAENIPVLLFGCPQIGCIKIAGFVQHLSMCDDDLISGSSF